VPASPVAAALRFLKEAAANLAEASTAIGGTDAQSAANIERLLQLVRAQIFSLEQKG